MLNSTGLMERIERLELGEDERHVSDDIHILKIDKTNMFSALPLEQRQIISEEYYNYFGNELWEIEGTLTITEYLTIDANKEQPTLIYNGYSLYEDNTCLNADFENIKGEPKYSFWFNRVHHTLEKIS